MNVFKFSLIFLVFFALFLACESTGAGENPLGENPLGENPPGENPPGDDSQDQVVNSKFHGIFERVLSEDDKHISTYRIVVGADKIYFTQSLFHKDSKDYPINDTFPYKITDAKGLRAHIASSVITTTLELTTDISGTPTFTIDFKEENGTLQGLTFPDTPTKAEIFPVDEFLDFPLAGRYALRPPKKQ